MSIAFKLGGKAWITVGIINRKVHHIFHPMLFRIFLFEILFLKIRLFYITSNLIKVSQLTIVVDSSKPAEPVQRTAPCERSRTTATDIEVTCRHILLINKKESLQMLMTWRNESGDEGVASWLECPNELSIATFSWGIRYDLFLSQPQFL